MKKKESKADAEDLPGFEPTAPRNNHAVSAVQNRDTEESGHNSAPVAIFGENVHITESSIRVLVELAERNPSIAEKLLETTEVAMKTDERKFRWGTITGLVIAITIIVGSVYLIGNVGFFAGIAFFLICVTIAAVLSVILNGHHPDLSWTKSILKNKNDVESHDT